MRNMILPGENVHVGFVGSNVSSTSSAAVVLTDANGAIRTLQSFERLVIDDLICDVSAGSVDLINAAAGSAAAVSSTLLASFNTTVGQWETAKEGMSCAVGVVPSLLSSNGNNTVKLAGSGRIVEATTQGVRPNWKESSNSRGL
jgi:hypothetical protein